MPYLEGHHPRLEIESSVKLFGGRRKLHAAQVDAHRTAAVPVVAECAGGVGWVTVGEEQPESTSRVGVGVEPGRARAEAEDRGAVDAREGRARKVLPRKDTIRLKTRQNTTRHEVSQILARQDTVVKSYRSIARDLQRIGWRSRGRARRVLGEQRALCHACAVAHDCVRADHSSRCGDAESEPWNVAVEGEGDGDGAWSGGGRWGWLGGEWGCAWRCVRR